MSVHEASLIEYPILYVDDERSNRIVMKHNLTGRFTLYLAESGADALDCLEHDFVAVLLADQRMPGMTGVELAERVLQSHPEVVRVIITAYSDVEATIDAINRARVSRFIKKPWGQAELEAVLRESIMTYHNAQLLKEMREQLTQLDRMNSMAITSASIAHDLRQPLSCIHPNLQSLQEQLEDLAGEVERGDITHDRLREHLGWLKEGLDDIASGVDRFNKLSEGLLTSLRVRERNRELVNMQLVVETALALSRTTIQRVARMTQEVATEPLWILGHEGRAIQLVMNLLLNASQAISPGATSRNRVTVRVRRQGELVRLEVEDTGHGIRETDLQQIFQPFFSTKGSRGSGLGLPICKQIAEEMSGDIRVESIRGRGTTFIVLLPLVDPPDRRRDE